MNTLRLQLAALLTATVGLHAAADTTVHQPATETLSCVGYRSAPTDDLSLLSGDLHISYSDKLLTIRGTHEIACLGEIIKAEIRVSDNVIAVHPYREAIPDEFPADCMCPTEFTTSLQIDLPENDYTIITCLGNQLDTGSIWNAHIKEGTQLMLTSEEASQEKALRENSEWVFYNAASSDFIRVRIQESPSIEENQDTRYIYRDSKNIYACIGDATTAFDIDKAIPVGALTSNTDTNICIWHTSYDVTIPSEFPSILFGYPEDPATVWPKTVSINKNYTLYYDFSDTRRITLFDYYENAYKGTSIAELTTLPVDGESTLSVTYNNGAQWIRGIGPVGDTYASNFFLPAYSLPDGIAPTHFLYLRDLTDGHIVYGDDSIEKELAAAAGISATGADRWFDNGSEFGVTATGETRIYVSDTAGRCMTAMYGTDGAVVERTQLDPGIYVVTVISPRCRLAKKIIVR